MAEAPSSGPPILEAQGLTKRFGTVTVLDRGTLDVRSGDRVVIVGRSGSGKTTFLRCLNLLEVPDQGSLLLNGQAVGRWGTPQGLVPGRQALRSLRQHVGMVFQSFELFANLSALDNVSLGLRKALRMPRDEASARASDMLIRVGLGDRTHARPSELSGGQKQRVAIARALAMEPQVVLFDEPTSALDPEMVGEVLRVMRDLAERDITMVIVTHEINFARQIGTHAIVFDKGRIVEDGSASQVLSEPASEAGRALLSTLDSW